MWEDSSFSQLQIIPRDGKPVVSDHWDSENALAVVASEIRKLISECPLPRENKNSPQPQKSDKSLDLVRGQVRAYAQLYERVRQRMSPSRERTRRMEEVFQKLKSLALASYPLLEELVNSPSPGERLAAVAILQVFSGEDYLKFLVELVSKEKPFVGYHACLALRYAVGAVNTNLYPAVLAAIQKAQSALIAASVGFDTDRKKQLILAEKEIQTNIDALAVPIASFDGSKT